MVGDRTLQRHYDEHNVRYFGGKLPPCKPVWEDLTKLRAVGRENYDVIEGKFRSDGRWRIIRRDYRIGICHSIKKLGSFWRSTLLHEMAHIAVDQRGKKVKHHGTTWQQEMMRLATAGAFKDLW